MSSSNRILSSYFTALLASASVYSADGVITLSGTLGTGNNDALVGLSSSKTYFNAVNLNGGALSINGVNFAASAGPNPSGSGFQITGVPLTYNGGGVNPAGQLGVLTNQFVYNGNPAGFTLNSLTPGQTYILTFYNRSWEAAGARVQNVVASSGATGTFDENVGATGQGQLNLVRYTFTASAATETLNITPQLVGNTMHIYGFSTEQAFNNTWTAGSNWTSSTWSVGTPNAAGTNADFTAQAAPTSLNLDAAQTVGHVRFDGANAWTISGSNALTFQADVGGASVVATTSGTHSISTPVTFGSDLLKTGAGRLVLTGAITDNGKNITLGAGTLEVVNNAAQTLSGGISGGGSLVKSGTGILTLSGAVNYTGTTTLGAGTLEIANTAASTLSGVISGSAPLIKSGAGTLSLTGLNTYSGVTTLSAGILNVASLADYGQNSALGNRASDSGPGNVGILFRGGTLQYTGSTPQSTNRAIRVSTVGGATIDASGSVPSATLNFTAASSPDFFETGGNRTLTFTGTNTGANTFNMAIGQAGGTTSVNKNGPGTWYLTGNNSYGGVTTLNGGILNVASISNFGVNSSIGNRTSDASGGQVGIVFAGGTLQYTGSTAQSTNRAIRVSTVGGGTIDASGSNPSATLSFTAASSPDFFVNGGNRSLTFTGTNTGNNTFSMAIQSIGGNTAVNKNGVGTWVFNGNSTYTGQTNINAGTLRIQTSTALGAGGFDGISNTNVKSGATLEIDGSLTLAEHFHFAGSGVGSTGAVKVLSGNSTITTDGALDNDGTQNVTMSVASGASLSFNAPLYSEAAVVAGITKIGAGLLTYNGNTTYTGATLINDGTFRVNGTMTGSAVTVTGSSSLLGGGGTINGAVSLLNGGTLAPGSSAGDLTVDGAVTFGSGSVFSAELLGGASFDQLTIGATGSLLSNSGNIVLTLGYAPAISDSFMVIENLAGTATASFANLAEGASIFATYNAVSYELQASYLGGTGNDLVLTVVPEPTAPLSMLASFGLLLRNRRRA